MGTFRGKRFPDYNPFWEEPAYEDQEDHWFWYHFGYTDGYAEGRQYHEKVEDLLARIEQLENLLSANVRVMKAEIKKEIGLVGLEKYK